MYTILFIVVFCNIAWHRDPEASYWGDEPDPAEAAAAPFSDSENFLGLKFR
jgi:hypothetical protein